MTREQEAITYFEGQKKRLEDFRTIYPSHVTVGYQATTKEISFYDMAITALSAIEKIRAEIEESRYITQDPIYARGLETALEIIDKYIGGKDK